MYMYSLAAITDALVQEASITSALRYSRLIENSAVSGMLEVCLNHHVFTNVGVLCLVV